MGKAHQVGGAVLEVVPVDQARHAGIVDDYDETLVLLLPVGN
jgi:hypothetical protein